MVQPNPANMDECDAKCRCKEGPFKGFAYSCESPCDANAIFDKQICNCEPLVGTWMFTGVQGACRTPDFPVVNDGRENCDRPSCEVTVAINQTEFDNGGRLRYTRADPGLFSCVGTIGFAGPEEPVDMQCFPGDCEGTSFGCGIRIEYDVEPPPPAGTRAILRNAGCKCRIFPISSGQSSAPCGGCYLRGNWIFMPPA